LGVAGRLKRTALQGLQRDVLLGVAGRLKRTALQSLQREGAGGVAEAEGNAVNVADDEVEEEEANVARPLRDPRAPSAAERAAHAATHLPFRSWCAECVAGRRDNPAHRRINNEEDEKGGVPEIAMDYCFIRREEEEQVLTVLVLKDRASRAVQAIRVERKGAEDEATCDRVLECVRRFGYQGRILMKTDNEPAILSLKSKIMEKLANGAIAVEPPVHESESNGSVENGVKLIKGLLRVHLLALERKVGARFPTAHPVIAWLIEHVADIATKYLQGVDGRTGYERLYGKKVHEECLEFGERIFWRKRRSEDMNVVLDSRWAEGLWLGRRWGAIQHRISVANEVFEVRAVQRKPLADRWDRAALEAVKAVPWLNPAPDEAQPLRVLPPLGDERPSVPERARPETGPKRVYLRHEDLERWGYTANCLRCKLMRERKPAAGKAHSEACRSRIEEAMRGEGDSRVLAADDRRAAPREAPVAVQAGGPTSSAWEALLGPDGEVVEMRPYRDDSEVLPNPRQDDDIVVTGVRQRPTPQVQIGGSSSSSSGGPSAPVPRAEEERRETEPGSDAWRDLAARLRRGGPAVQLEQETVPERDVVMDYLCPELCKDDAAAKEALDLYELILSLGAEPTRARHCVAELYSPPRVTAELGVLPNLALEPGMTFDLQEDREGVRWDFLRASDRARAREAILREQPVLVVGSPPCTAFCSFNERLNYRRMQPETVRRKKAEAKVLLGFAMEIYELQLKAGRHFLHEHPASASSWSEPRMMALMKRRGVGGVVAHMCQFGMETRSGSGSLPALKPTRFLSSAPEILKRLERKCRGEHSHQRLSGGRASAAAVYPPALCRAILEGIDAQLRREGRVMSHNVQKQLDNGCAIYALHTDGSPDLGEEMVPEAGQEKVWDEEESLRAHAPQRYWDAITNEELPPDLTAASRAEEIAFMKEWEVWDVVPISESWRLTGRAPLQGKWVDVNKGDFSRPVIRSRYVAKEFADKRSDEFFAATPPLEALRMVISHAASGRRSSRGGRKILVIDARKAHLHAMAERAVCVALPPEIKEPGKCALLKRCLYGTRDAPARWEAFLASELEKMGFLRGKASPCCFHHPQWDLRCVVHGDDFVFAGGDDDLAWVQSEMDKRFLVKVIGKLGGDAGDLSELRVLNRVLSWGPEGIRVEADPRHQEILTAQLEESARSLSTAGVKDKPEGKAEGRELNEAETKSFRSGAARANYLSLDRPDLSFATKELCRRMSQPSSRDTEALLRVCRYLKGAPRVVYEFRWQPEVGIQAYVDTDFAGCLATRRSTSGGCAMRGTHLLKHWSSTQKTVTLSSGEAELNGIVKGAAEALGLQSLGRDLGLEMELSLHTDSAAAVGICRRSGIGKVRHLAVGQLWVQEKLKSGAFRLYKIAGTENPADALTKHLARDVLDKHLKAMCLQRLDGRAMSAPKAQIG
jgi:hypothetical protein